MNTHTATVDTVRRNVRRLLACTPHDIAAALARAAHRLDDDAPTLDELWRDGHDVGQRTR